jgi:Family of unknown function (DUF6056)
MLSRLAKLTLATTTSVALLTLAVRGLFIRWFADDYWIAAAMATHGFWGGQAFWYRVWSGRYAFNFVVALLETLGPVTTPPLLALTVVALVGALARSIRLTLALAVAWAILLGAPDASQSVLWQTGLFSYTIPIVAFAWWLSLAGASDDWRWPAALIPLLSGGFSEIGVIAQIIVCMGAFLAWRKKAFVAGLTASVLSLLIIAAAPGNIVRKGVSPPTLPLLRLITYTLANSVHFVTSVATEDGIVLLLVFLAAALFAPRIQPRIAAVAAATAAACILASFAAGWATLVAPLALRALIIPYALVVAAVFALGASIPRNEAYDDRWRATRAAALIIVSLYPLYTALDVARSIPEARRFARGWDRMDTALRANRGGDVFLDRVPGRQGITMWFLANDPQDGLNRAMADAYGARSLARLPIYHNGKIVTGPLPPGAVRVRFYD